MVSIFSTAKIKHPKIKNINDEKLNEFDLALNKVLLNLAKRVVADGEGASKFITIMLKIVKLKLMQKKLHFQLQILH